MLLYSATCLFYSGVISKCSFFIIIIIRLIYVTFFCCFFTCTHTFIFFRTEKRLYCTVHFHKDFYNILDVSFTHKSTTSANAPMHRSYYRDRFELTHFHFLPLSLNLLFFLQWTQWSINLTGSYWNDTDLHFSICCELVNQTYIDCSPHITTNTPVSVCAYKFGW